MDCKINAELIPDASELEALPESACPVDWAKRCVDTAHLENCGKSVMCRDGMTQLSILINDVVSGRGLGDDLALIRLSGVPVQASVATFGDFNKVRNGEKVFVVGNSLGYGTCITSGIVSDRLRNVNGKMLLMTDCAINGGNSGGPMFNEKGEVIAVIVAGIDGAEGMNFAIPVDTVQQFLYKTPAAGVI